MAEKAGNETASEIADAQADPAKAGGKRRRVKVAPPEAETDAGKAAPAA